MVFIDFLIKSIVHGFDQFFLKSMDYSSWFDRVFEKKHGL